jgi:hypothetical protein
MTTFFVWEIFINKNNMNFQAILGTGLTQEQRIINAPSWSTCLAYCEGAGKDIQSIQLIPTSIIVLHDLNTTNCYTTVIKINEVITQYVVWVHNFESFTTWLNTLSNPIIQSITNQNKLYVTV